MSFCLLISLGIVIIFARHRGGIAQLVERLVRNEKARGSNPLTSSLRSRRRRERGLSRRSLGEGGHVYLAPRARRATTRQANAMAKFFYVYILQSEIDHERFYTGLTDDLLKRVRNHNSGRVLHTAKWRPWRLKAYIAFSDRSRAVQFERYLKSAAGGAFTKKHL